jgi:hypothetical protein
MGDLGLQGAYGAAGAADALRQLIKDRLIQQQQQFENARQLSADDRQNRQLDQNDQYRRDTLAETASRNKAADADRVMKENFTLNDQVPANTFLEPNSPIVGRLQSIGAVKEQQSRPSVDVGPLQPGDDGGAKKQGYLKLASEKQQTVQDAADAKVEAARLAAEGRTNDNEQKAKDRLAQIEAAKAGHQPTNSYQLQPEIDPATGKQTGRYFSFNTKTNTWQPASGEGPSSTKAAPGAAQLAQHDAAKQVALGSLTQLDQAIDNAKDFIGPGAGRISSIQQMVGSQDPAIQALGTKMLLAKMQVDHAASGTVRAGASPQLLARWDNILGQKVTPEGLKAAVQAMREILGSNAPSPATAGGSGIKSITEIK